MNVKPRRLRPQTPAISTPRARTMRRAGTPAEAALWRAVRARSLSGVKLRRQVPCGPWILDFAALAHRLAIEVDGDSHASESGREHDAARNAWLAARGWRVLRFSNRDVATNLEGVLMTIAQAASALTPILSRKRPHPGPLPQAGEGDCT